MGLAADWTDAGLWDLFDLNPMFQHGPDQYLSVTLERCVLWFRASGGSIFLREPHTDQFRLRAKSGLQSSIPDDTIITMGQGIAGVVAQVGRPKIINDPRLDPELVDAGVEHRSAIGSSMVIPLIDVHQEAIGVINLARANGTDPFAESDLEHAITLADHVALALSNARMVAELRDEITHRRVTNERLIAVLDSVAGAVVVVDATGQVLNHNQAAMRDSFLASQPGSDLSAVRDALRATTSRALETRESCTDRAHDASHDRTWLIQAAPLASGEAVVTVQEVTDHERSQREIARVRRLAEIGQMTAAIAHEIRNPLTGIRSAAQMITAHPETSAEFAGIIEEEALKLNRLCDEFLEFARPMRVELAPTDLGALVLRTVQLVSTEANEKQVSLLEDIEINQPTIEVDGPRIEQVVLNLVRNAIHATPAGGSITVRVENGAIAVEDSGIGMSDDEVSRLFSPFYTTKPDGTGLGLCNVRKIVDAHGGRIGVTSRPGQGSRFEVDLKRKAA